MPEISVIIPVYRVEKTLRQCVDSVLCQTYRDFEVILVDDGSPDSCGAICDEYAEHDNVVVIHKENGGLSDARNAGLSKARGDYVMFLDSDDYLSQDCLETLQGRDADMVIGSIVVLHEDGRKVYQKDRPDEMIPADRYAQVIPGLFKENRLNYVHAKLYRRGIILDHHLSFEDDMLTSAEDTVFNFTFLTFCKRIYVCSKQVHFYRYITSGLGKKFHSDRYARYCRLVRHITDCCETMGICDGEMRYEINRRMVYCALWSVWGILAEQSISEQEKIGLLDEIANDASLKSYARQYDSEIKNANELFYLQDKGSKKLLAYHRRKELLDRIKARLRLR